MEDRKRPPCPKPDETDRREFMKKVAAMAVYSSPMISVLAGSRGSAWADCPSGEGGGGEGEESSETVSPPGLRALIDIIVGGVDGDATRQAIQMRFFQPNQCVEGMDLWAWDATGANPVLIHSFGSEVLSHNDNDTVLIASPNFAAIDSPTPDFIMSNLLPASYLAAGSLTWQEGPVAYWRVCWGGAAYTGPTSVDMANDPDGTVAPAFNGGLPSSSTSGLIYDAFNNGGSEEGGRDSTDGASNWSDADYRFTSGAAVLKNNAGQTATLPVALQLFVIE